MNKEEYISLKELWRILLIKKWQIISVSLGAAIIAMVVSFFLPKTFTAEAVLLMPEAASGSSALSSPLGLLSPRFTSQQGLSSQVIKTVLESKKCLEKVVRKFNLNKVYKSKNTENTIDLLSQRTKIGIFNLTGEIRIQVKDRSPQRAAEICNYYISMIDTMNIRLKLTSDKSLIKILDFASPPRKKSSPKIKMNMIIAFLVAFFIITSYYAFSKRD